MSTILDNPKTAQDIPLVKGYPLIGSAFSILANPLEFFTRVMHQHEGMAAVKVGTITVYVANHPDEIKYVLMDNSKNYTKGPMYRSIRNLLGNGLPASEGSFWLRQRRLMQPAFHQQYLENIFSIMQDVVQETVESWTQAAENDQIIDVFSEMTKLTLRLIVRTMFSTDITKEMLEKIETSFAKILSLLNFRIWSFFLPRWIPIPGEQEFRKHIEALDTIVYKVISERRQNPEAYADLLSMLLAAQDEETNEQMTDEQVRDEVLTIFLAGHETTSTTLAWMWYELSQNPQAKNKIYEEVRATSSDNELTMTSLREYHYTRAAIDETLRLYPPAWILPRAATTDDVIGDYAVPADAMVVVIPYTIHRNPTYWENPNQFMPERFMTEHNFPRFAYIPFGGGPRQCIGNTFALIEAQLIMSTLLKHFDFELVSSALIEVKTTTTIRPRQPIHVRLKMVNVQN